MTIRIAAIKGQSSQAMRPERFDGPHVSDIVRAGKDPVPEVPRPPGPNPTTPSPGDPQRPPEPFDPPKNPPPSPNPPQPPPIKA